MKTTDLSGMGLMKGVGLIALAGAISILADAVKKFSGIDTGAMIKGLTGVAVVLTELGIFVNLTGNAKKVISTAIGLTILGAAMIIFAEAINKMGSMSWEGIAKGLTTMAGALTIITIALNAMPKSMILTGAGLVVVASSLVILSKALTTMGGMSWEGIAKGLLTLAGSLTIIAAAMIFMATALPGAAALLVVAGALAILTPVLTTLGAMSLGEIGKGLLALAGVFAVIGVAGLVLAPLTPIILGLSAAIALFGIGCLAVGAGVLAFSAGLTALSIAGTAGAAALTLIVSSLVGLIPYILKTLAQGIVDFAKTIGDGALVIAKAILQVVKAVTQALTQAIPDLVTAVMVLLTTVLETLVGYVPRMVDAGMKIIVGFLKGIADNIDEVVSTGIQIAVNFIEGVASMIPKVIQAGFDLILAYINGLADAIRKNTPLVIKAIKNLMSSIGEAGLQVLTGYISGFTDMGKNIIKGLINGITSMITAAGNAISGLANSVITSAKSVLGIHSPSTVFENEVGTMIGAGMAKGITKSGTKAVAATKKVSKEVVSVSKETYDSVKNWVDERKYYNELSLNEELAAWERVQKKYKAGTEERKKLDKEVYRVKQELIKSEEDAEEKAYQTSVDMIEERKYYNQLSLKEELEAWQKVQNRYLAGSEERKKADREVYRVQQEINSTNEDYTRRIADLEEQTAQRRKELEDEYYDKVKETNDKLIQDIQNANKEYEDAVNSRADSLYSAYGLFDKIESPEAVSGDELIGNLKDQVNAFDSWQKNIDELAKKGIDDGLLKELTDMGPQAADKIDALNQLSADKLTTYVTLWQTKHNEARTQAVGELESLRLETIAKISQLNAEAATQLEQYRVNWQNELTAVNADADKQLSALQTEWATKLGVLTDNAEKEFKDMQTKVQTTVQTMRADTEKEFTT
jgi:hypothetical protein